MNYYEFDKKLTRNATCSYANL